MHSGVLAGPLVRCLIHLSCCFSERLLFSPLCSRPRAPRRALALSREPVQRPGHRRQYSTLTVDFDSSLRAAPTLFVSLCLRTIAIGARAHMHAARSSPDLAPAYTRTRVPTPFVSPHDRSVTLFLRGTCCTAAVTPIDRSHGDCCCVRYYQGSRTWVVVLHQSCHRVASHQAGCTGHGA